MVSGSPNLPYPRVANLFVSLEPEPSRRWDLDLLGALDLSYWKTMSFRSQYCNVIENLLDMAEYPLNQVFVHRVAEEKRCYGSAPIFVRG